MICSQALCYLDCPRGEALLVLGVAATMCHPVSAFSKQSRGLDLSVLIFPPLLMFRQQFENVKLLFVPAVWEQLSLGFLYVGSRSQRMLPF